MSDFSYTGYNYHTKQLAKNLRKNMTRQERHLWYDFLKSYRPKFYRQRSIDHYIVDFFCSEIRLVIELDGSQHYTDDGLVYDSIRTDVLEKYGLEVLRFSNNDIDREFTAVCEAIDNKVKNTRSAKTKETPIIRKASDN